MITAKQCDAYATVRATSCNCIRYPLMTVSNCQYFGHENDYTFDLNMLLYGSANWTLNGKLLHLE